MISLSDPAVTGFFTLAGSLGGVAVSQRYSMRLAADARQEERRAALRPALQSLQLAVGTLVDNAYIMILFMAKAKPSDLAEFINTDSGKQLAETHKAIREAMGGVLLMAGDIALKRALGELQDCIVNWSDETAGPAEQARSGKIDQTEAIRLGMAHVRKTDRAMAAVLAAAVPLVQVTISHSEARRRVRAGWRWKKRTETESAPATD